MFERFLTPKIGFCSPEGIQYLTGECEQTVKGAMIIIENPICES